MKTSILFAAVFCICCACSAQTFHNLDFSQACDTAKTGLCYWRLSWGGKGACRPAEYHNNPCLLIEGKSTSSVGFAEQEGMIEKSQGLQIIALSANIRTENVEGKGADLNIAVYDSNGNFVTNKDMGGYAFLGRITGSSDYKTYQLKALVPAGAASIRIGAILYGKGKVMYDDFKVSVSPVANRSASPLATRYINAACDTIMLHSLVKDSVDINKLKKQALLIAGPAKSYEDCYLAVEYLIFSLRQFGDVHSLFMKASDVAKWKNDTTRAAQIAFPKSKMISGYGYLWIPRFDGGNKKMIRAFADTIQQAIKNLSRQGVKGWIVDLRDDMGGNMEPMLAGLGPLFSADTLGYLVNAYGVKDPWTYKEYLSDVSEPTVALKQLPIAVLTGHNAGSSGEIVVISFVGNAKTRSFGQPTWGLTTGNGSFDLMDGARMQLASTVMADRNGRLYHGPVQPDEVLEDKRDPDIVLNRAIEWLSAVK